MANLIRGGRGVILALNAGKLWGESTLVAHGGVNHAVTVTGVACDMATGAINGFYIADSGRGKVSDMTRYVGLTALREAANVTNAYAIYTTEPIKLWEEDINGSGNALDNQVSGNRGNNVLSGGAGNDILVGGAGDDTYVFNRGDGQDTIIENDATPGNTDTLLLNHIDQTNLWFSQLGNDLRMNVMGTADQITVKDWFVTGTPGSCGPSCISSASGSSNPASHAHTIERIQTADALTLDYGEVNALVQAMASFDPPAAGQTRWTSGQTSHGVTLLAVTH